MAHTESIVLRRGSCDTMTGNRALAVQSNEGIPESATPSGGRSLSGKSEVSAFAKFGIRDAARESVSPPNVVDCQVRSSSCFMQRRSMEASSKSALPTRGTHAATSRSTGLPSTAVPASRHPPPSCCMTPAMQKRGRLPGTTKHLAHVGSTSYSLYGQKEVYRVLQRVEEVIWRQPAQLGEPHLIRNPLENDAECLGVTANSHGCQSIARDPRPVPLELGQRNAATGGVGHMIYAVREFVGALQNVDDNLTPRRD